MYSHSVEALFLKRHSKSRYSGFGWPLPGCPDIHFSLTWQSNRIEQLFPQTVKHSLRNCGRCLSCFSAALCGGLRKRSLFDLHKLTAFYKGLVLGFFPLPVLSNRKKKKHPNHSVLTLKVCKWVWLTRDQDSQSRQSTLPALSFCHGVLFKASYLHMKRACESRQNFWITKSLACAMDENIASLWMLAGSR